MDNDKLSARAARRLLDARIRTDWDWPNRPAPWSASDEEVRGVSEFRERYYATTSASASEAEEEEDSYRFDSPDTVASTVQSKANNRKRKRRAVMESEMSWNEGLTCFVRRRDAWTGAEAVKKYGTSRPAKKDTPQATAEEDNDDDTSASHPAEPPVINNTPTTDPTFQNIEPLVPLPPSLLENNPIRDCISPKIYPEIYQKVVVSGRTPSVPINLSDMTRALVAGWKDVGEWPPKAGPLDPLAGRRRPGLGLQAVRKSQVGVHHSEGQFLAHHPHVKKGMESVKRIFHLSGGSHRDSDQHSTGTAGTPGTGTGTGTANGG